MEKKFTQGEWKLNDVGTDSKPYREIIITSDDEIVAFAKGDSREEAEANAKLISAAKNFFEAVTGEDVPQLYRNEWLGTLLRMFERREYKYCGSSPDANAEAIMMDEIKAMYELNKAAIKKATE